MSWYFAVLSKYAVFQGRARRKEYWMFVLMNFIVAFVLGFLGSALGLKVAGGFNLIGLLYAMLVMLPSIAVGVRRLHDIGRSGGWMWIALIPLLGSILLLVWAVLDSEPGQNAYGPNPKTSPA